MSSNNAEEATFIVAENNQSTQVTIEVIKVFLVLIPIVFTSILAVLLTSKFCQRNSFKEFLVQTWIIVIPLILSVTVYVDVICHIISPILIIGFIGVIYKILRRKRSLEKFKISVDERPQSVTFFRSTVNIVTSCAILACDFEIFPREFHKSRTYNVGLMDTGIGFFVVSMGMVSKPLRNIRDLKKLLIQAGPLLFLGITRTVVIRSIGYYQDEREYGRDLNAFITLGTTKVLSGLVTMVVPSNIPLIVPGIILAVLHETLLQSGLANYCLSETVERESFFEANREGIVSLLGFVSIYLISLYIGSLLRYSRTEFKGILIKIACVSMTAWILALFTIHTSGISRRIANFGYVSWVVALSTSLLSIFILIFDVISKLMYKSDKRYIPVVFDAINFNGLIYFLVSNILTGTVNIFLNPSQRNPVESIFILIVYMIIPCILNRYLFVKNIRLC